MWKSRYKCGNWQLETEAESCNICKVWKILTLWEVQLSCSVVSDSATPWTAARQASLSITNSWSLLKLMSIESVMPSNHLILCFPFSSRLQSFQTSGSFQMSQFFTSGGQSIEFQLQHQSFQWIFRTDFPQDGLVGSPYRPRDSEESSLTPQFKSIDSLVLRFIYSPTLTSIHDYWKAIALTRQIFVGKVMCLLLNMLWRLVITFLPRSKHF